MLRSRRSGGAAIRRLQEQPGRYRVPGIVHRGDHNSGMRGEKKKREMKKANLREDQASEATRWCLWAQTWCQPGHLWSLEGLWGQRCPQGKRAGLGWLGSFPLPWDPESAREGVRCQQTRGTMSSSSERFARPVHAPVEPLATLCNWGHPGGPGVFDGVRDTQPPGDNSQAETFQPRAWVNPKGEPRTGRGCAIAGSRRSHTPAERGHASTLCLTLGITGRRRGGLVVSWGVPAPSHCPGKCQPLSGTSVTGICCISKQKSSGAPRVQPRG